MSAAEKPVTGLAKTLPYERRKLRTMEWSMPGIHSDERQILTPQSGQQVEPSRGNGEDTSGPNVLSNSIDQTSLQHQERAKRHSQRMCNSVFGDATETTLL